jgi:hypothetical protein
MKRLTEASSRLQAWSWDQLPDKPAKKQQKPAKPKTMAEIALDFVYRFADSDALQMRRFSGLAKDLTKEHVEAVAWDLGYEQSSYDSVLKPYEAWAKTMGADLKKSWSEGKAAR